MKPFVCPLCNGEGKKNTGESNTAGQIREYCHPCSGTGIVWGPPDVVSIPTLWFGHVTKNNDIYYYPTIEDNSDKWYWYYEQG